MTLEIGGKTWAQWNWLDRLGTGPVPTLVLTLQEFFATVNPSHLGHELSMPVLPTLGDPATRIGFRIRIRHPQRRDWSLLMTAHCDTPYQQHTGGLNKIAFAWSTGYDDAYDPSEAGQAYGGFDDESPDRWIVQNGMPYIDYPDVGGTILMFRDTTPGEEFIWFWLANHGEPVAENTNYAPQWFGLQWSEAFDTWVFLGGMARNQRPAGSLQSGPKHFDFFLAPSAICSNLTLNFPANTNVFFTNPTRAFSSASNADAWGVLNPGGSPPVIAYPPCMVAGYFPLDSVAGMPFSGNRVNVPGFGMLYQLGTFSTQWVSLTDDEFLFFWIPQDAVVPSGWLAADLAFPWLEPVTPPMQLYDWPRPAVYRQLPSYLPDNETVFGPSVMTARDFQVNPFYETFAPGLVSGGGGSSLPDAGVLWPRRG